MSFTAREHPDFLQLLAEHPGWRKELRRALLSAGLVVSEDFLASPVAANKDLTERALASAEREGVILVKKEAYALWNKK